MIKMRTLIGAAAMAGVVAAGGSAFTASNSLPADEVTRGYGSQTISGVTAEEVTYNTNPAKDTITSVGLVLTGDTTTKVIQIAFSDANPATCSDLGAFDELAGSTAYSCTVSQAVVDATKFALIAE